MSKFVNDDSVSPNSCGFYKPLIKNEEHKGLGHLPDTSQKLVEDEDQKEEEIKDVEN